MDLYHILWLKSADSETWLERRTTYTRSLAVMSMVGYILGLGDRHMSNIMLGRLSGRIVHIDFGDCFEVAMDRDQVSICMCICICICNVYVYVYILLTFGTKFSNLLPIITPIQI